MFFFTFLFLTMEVKHGLKNISHFNWATAIFLALCQTYLQVTYLNLTGSAKYGIGFVNRQVSHLFIQPIVISTGSCVLLMMTDCIIMELAVVGQRDNQINQHVNSYLIAIMRSLKGKAQSDIGEKC